MKRDCTIQVAKPKALISFAVTAKLICVFVFAYAKSRFSHDEAHLTVAFISLRSILSFILLICSIKHVYKHLVYNFHLNPLLHEPLEKLLFCIRESKAADQLHGNRAADQRLFSLHNSTLVFPKYEISSL